MAAMAAPADADADKKASHRLAFFIFTIECRDVMRAVGGSGGRGVEVDLSDQSDRSDGGDGGCRQRAFGNFIV